MNIFSTPAEIEKIKNTLIRYLKLPFSTDVVPGAIMEGVLSRVRGGIVLNTYDFVDVIKPKSFIGWQVKSTKASTPVTWKRAKIANALELIEGSKRSEIGLKNLGKAIIDFCNDHAKESLEKYNLNQIGYSRLVVHSDGGIVYFERLLCTKENPLVFNPEDFYWRWSTPKNTKKKEQLPALHGFHHQTNEKWWAWHGLGENQLHFSGESAWWPQENSPHAIAFRFPEERIALDRLFELLEALNSSA